MEPKVWVEKATFNDDTELVFSPNQITILVGPNNSGKSITLKELDQLTREENRTGTIVKKIELQKEGAVEDILELIKNNSIIDGDANYRGFGYIIREQHISHYWKQRKMLEELQPIFVNLLSTEDRLRIVNPPSNISLINEAVQHPIHFLQKDDSIELKFSQYFQQAFNEELIVHRNAGSKVPLYIGKRPTPKEGEDRVSISYTKELEKLPLLHQQGDGMRSFVGLLLSAFVASHKILLIDEPEAFLHPPQVRLLGKMLAKDLPSDRQLFLATHSGDFLKGLLDADISNLKIVRIRREENKNKISELNNSDIQELWKDPLLRYSNILDGLFHSKVIICESDSDCRFYSAILQSVFENKSNLSPDYLFIPSGGKQRIPMIIRSLKKLEVKINTIVDFDVLNDSSPLREIVETSNGNWASIETDWKLVKNSVDSRKPELETKDFKEKLSPILDSTTETIFPPDKIKEIKSLLRKTSAWSVAKTVGKNFIPSGEPSQAYQRLISELEKIGILVVEEGEIESFVKSIGNHGPKWVNEVLTRNLKEDSELSLAREFVKKLI